MLHQVSAVGLMLSSCTVKHSSTFCDFRGLPGPIFTKPNMWPKFGKSTIWVYLTHEIISSKKAATKFEIYSIVDLDT